MATFYGAQKSSADGVLAWYEDQEQSNYVIYRHNTKAETARYEGGDKEVGMHRLDRFLSEIEPSDFAIYILQLLPSSKKKEDTAPCLTFQLYKNQPGYQSGYSSPVTNEILSELRAIRSERFNKDEEEEDEDETVGAVQPNLMSMLSGVLNHPQVQNILVNMLTSIAGNFMKPKTNPVTSVSGVDEETNDIAKTIEILFEKGVTPSDLKKLASMDQGQINFLLTMLRK
jgi:hypothetical protein